MAKLSNDNAIPRKPVPGTQRSSRVRRPSAVSFLSTSLLVLLVSTLPWARSWLYSGAAIETLLVLWGWEARYRILPQVPLWTLLSSLNLIYAVCSTSWLLNGFFTAGCWPWVIITCLVQSPTVARYTRRALRKGLREYPSHFVRDKIALFNLPALEIDTTVHGLMVIRAVTLSLSSLTLVAHGIEVGIKLANDIELAIYVDEVTVRLFRKIEIGDVYANLKGGNAEMTFAEVEDAAEVGTTTELGAATEVGSATDDAASEVSVFNDDTPLLRAASFGAASFKDRPKLRESLAGGSYIADSSAKEGMGGVETLSPDDELAGKEYEELMTEIRTSSAIYQSRAQVRKNCKDGTHGFSLNSEKDLRAAMAAELHTYSSISHPPHRSIRVTTLQNLSPPATKRFMHRLPFLLRALLAPLSYFHPIAINSINAAGSGQWVSELLQSKVFKKHTEHNAELRRLWNRLSKWLSGANFCLELSNMDCIAAVPFNAGPESFIYTAMRLQDMVAYRTAPQTGTVSPVVRLGGAHATFYLPSYLLPHHEHLVPRKPTTDDEFDMEITIEEADEGPKTTQAERDLETLKKDETAVKMSVHGSFPASCDQSLLDFIAALVKATKLIEFEKEIEETGTDFNDGNVPPSPTSQDGASEGNHDGTNGVEKLSFKDIAGFKATARNIRQNIKQGSIDLKQDIKSIAKDLNTNTREGMKKAMVGGLVNDRWIAKLVGKTAAFLKEAQGDVGYSGNIPIALAPYRGEEGLESKLLP